MKLAVAFILLTALVVLGVVVTVALLRAGLRWWRHARGHWFVEEESDGEQVCVYACRPGEDHLLIGAVPFAARDFDSRLYELRAEGREKVYALNQASKRPLLGDS